MSQLVLLNEVEKLKQEVVEQLKDYQLVPIVDDESYKEAKKQRASLNKLVESVDKERKRITKKLKSDIESVLELIPLNKSDEYIKDYEEQLRSIKKEAINNYFASLEFPEEIKLETIFKDNWTNITFDFEKELKTLKEKIDRDLEILPLISDTKESREIYFETLDLAQVKDKLENKPLPFNLQEQDDLPFEREAKQEVAYRILFDAKLETEIRSYLFERGVKVEKLYDL